MNMQLEKSTVEVFAAGRLVESFKSEKELLSIAPARICEWDAMSQRHSRDAVQLALNTGALLLEVKSRLPHGTFLLWLEQNCGSVSERTARNYMRLAKGAQESYMKLAEKAAQRECKAIADGADDDGEVIEGEATVKEASPSSPAPLVDELSLTQLYLGFGIVRRNDDNWGGDRRYQAAKNGKTVGRPVAAPSPEERSRRDWIAVLAPMRKLTDVSYRFLPLADASAALADLDAASKRLKARIEELKHGGIRKGDWDEAPVEAEP